MPLAQIALAYTGIALAAVALRHAEAARRIAALRGAWFGAWLTVVLMAAIARPVPADLFLSALTIALWVTARGLGSHVAWLGVLATCAEAWTRLGTPAAMAHLVGFAGGLLLSHAMTRHRWLAARVVAHWLSFAGTFVLLLPLALADRTRPVSHINIAAAVIVALAAALLAGFATLAFMRAGGTPEPLDPPRHLVTHGPYARVRHPIQVAELLLVGAAAIVYPQPVVVLYVAGLAAALIGPLRWHEERQLHRRFGAAYTRWQLAVPAYWPWRRTDDLRSNTSIAPAWHPGHKSGS